MGCITEHLYVTEAQKACVVPRPRNILPNSLPRLSRGSGWARLPEFNSKHSRGWFRPPCKTTFSWLWHLPAKDQIPGTTGTSPHAKTQRGCAEGVPQAPELGLQTWPCLLWRTLSTLWFRVKGWGWDIVSVFITSGNVQSDSHHACGSKAEWGVILLPAVLWVWAPLWWADPKVSWGGEESSKDSCLGVGLWIIGFLEQSFWPFLLSSLSMPNLKKLGVLWNRCLIDREGSVSICGKIRLVGARWSVLPSDICHWPAFLHGLRPKLQSSWPLNQSLHRWQPLVMGIICSIFPAGEPEPLPPRLLNCASFLMQTRVPFYAYPHTPLKESSAPSSVIPLLTFHGSVYHQPLFMCVSLLHVSTSRATSSLWSPDACYSTWQAEPSRH